MSSEDVEVGIRIRFEGDSKSIGARITQHAIFSTRFDVLAYTVDTLFAQLRSEFASLPQGESQQRADAGKASGIKIAELERDNAALRHSEENLAATVRGLEFELEKAEKATATLSGTVEAYGDANDRLTVENAALRKDKERLTWLLEYISAEGTRGLKKLTWSLYDDAGERMNHLTKVCEDDVADIRFDRAAIDDAMKERAAIDAARREGGAT